MALACHIAFRRGPTLREGVASAALLQVRIRLRLGARADLVRVIVAAYISLLTLIFVFGTADTFEVLASRLTE